MEFPKIKRNKVSKKPLAGNKIIRRKEYKNFSVKMICFIAYF